MDLILKKGTFHTHAVKVFVGSTFAPLALVSLYLLRMHSNTSKLGVSPGLTSSFRPCEKSHNLQDLPDMLQTTNSKHVGKYDGERKAACQFTVQYCQVLCAHLGFDIEHECSFDIEEKERASLLEDFHAVRHGEKRVDNTAATCHDAKKK